jgi:hypothetical protein
VHEPDVGVPARLHQRRVDPGPTHEIRRINLDDLKG